MKCFQFSNDDHNKTRKSTSGQSSASVFTDSDLKGSEYSSQNVSTDISTVSFSCLSNKKACHLKVFTVEELKSATKNFSRSLMLGEGGFGGVYKGVLKDTNIAVKQLSQRGLQASFI